MGYEFNIGRIKRGLTTERTKIDNKKALKWAVLVVTAITIGVAVFFNTILGVARVTETSMYPTLRSGDWVIFNRMEWKFEKNDIVIFRELKTRDTYIKRVIATSGDKVDIQDGKVYVNDEQLSEPYIYESETSATGDVEFPVHVPEGYIFVLGDNREVSVDSRSSNVGMVKESNIRGKLIYPNY